VASPFAAWCCSDARTEVTTQLLPLVVQELPVDAERVGIFGHAMGGHGALTLRRHADYDHGYYFISTFIADHLAHHAQTLLAASPMGLQLGSMTS
jgi:S-formylglutathione hydrolase FrmB